MYAVISDHHGTRRRIPSSADAILRAQKRILSVSLARNGGGLQGVHDLLLPVMAETHEVAALDPVQMDPALRVRLLEADADRTAPVQQGKIAIRKIKDLFQILRDEDVLFVKLRIERQLAFALAGDGGDILIAELARLFSASPLASPFLLAWV
jgi:hypothetical protein